MKTITQKLNMTQAEFEEMIFGFYFRWCQDVTTNDLDFQAVLANAGINKWFLTELAKLEAKFQEITWRYEDSETVITRDYKLAYNDCTFQMFNIRPMALLENAKIKQPKGHKPFNLLYQN